MVAIREKVFMKKNKENGFSLIEVNMAVLVVGLGILVLFGLFPSGLREGENGIVDTHCALFAETVLEGLRAEVHNNPDLLDWLAWQDLRGRFKNNLKFNMPNGAGTIEGDAVLLHKDLIVRGPIKFPEGANPTTYIWYAMQISEGSTDMAHTVNLWVWSGQYVTKDPEEFIIQTEWYATKYFYGEGI